MSVQRKFPVIPDVSRSVQDEFRQLRNMAYDAQQKAEDAHAAIQNLKPGTGPQGAPGEQGKPGTTTVITATTGTGGNSVTSATGDNPNVTQILGVLAQAQRSYIPEFTSVPILSDPASQNGSLISVNGLLYRFDGSSQPGVWRVQDAVAAYLEDLYVNWTLLLYPPANYTLGTQFLILDWNVVYTIQIVAGVRKWVWHSGTYEAAYSSLPTTGFNGAALNANDKGLRFYDNTTYFRQWEWATVNWVYAPGELPGGDTSPAIMMLAGNVTPPGWALCSVGSINITTSHAALVSFTVPPFASGGYYPKGGAYTGGGGVGVVNPTISASLISGSADTAAGSDLSMPTGVTASVVSPGEPEHIVIPFYVKL